MKFRLTIFAGFRDVSQFGNQTQLSALVSRRHVRGTAGNAWIVIRMAMEVMRNRSAIRDRYSTGSTSSRKERRVSMGCVPHFIIGRHFARG